MPELEVKDNSDALAKVERKLQIRQARLTAAQEKARQKELNKRGAFFEEDYSRFLQAQGIDVRPGDRHQLLEQAKKVAAFLALQRPDRTLYADLVQDALVKGFPGYTVGALGAAAGGMFRGKNWKNTRTTHNSTYKQNHGRIQWRWKYLGN